MKKCLYILTLVLMISITVGCDNKKEEVKKVEKKKELDYKSIYMEVLDGKRNFIDESDREVSFNEYLNTEKGSMDSAKVTYTYIDFDNKDSSNHEEMLVLTETNDGYYLILNYDISDDKVYGIYKNYRDMVYIKGDATIYGSGGVNANYIYKLILDKNKYEEITLAENDDGVYKINNEEVSESEYNKYMEDYNSKESVVFTDYKTIELISNDTSNTGVSNSSSNVNIYGTYYLELTDGTIVDDGSGTIILNSDSTCKYYSGWSDMGCTSYKVESDSVCLNLSETGSSKCFTIKDNILIDNYDNYIKSN